MVEQIKKVNFLGQYLSSFRSDEQILDMSMRISQDVLGYDHAIIRLQEGGLLKAVKWIGFPREAADMPIRVGEGISGEVARTGTAILVEDTTRDPRFLKGVENCRSELCVPMTYNARTVGVFNVESDKQGFFSEKDRHILETFAQQISAALETARLREELARAEKLSAVGAFASSILHDIRNDIHRLNISSDMLENTEPDRKKNREISQIVKRSAENIYGLIEDIFEFVQTGRSSTAKRKQKIAPFLKAVAEDAREFSQNGVEIVVRADSGMEMKLDKRRMRRALLNLAKNATEAMPEGGRLTLAASVKNGAAVIKVRDTGVGIEPERLDKIWDLFYTHGKKHGTGLGMAIVRKIVEDHGWTVTAKSKPGKGTEFTITAPETG